MCTGVLHDHIFLPKLEDILEILDFSKFKFLHIWSWICNVFKKRTMCSGFFFIIAVLHFKSLRDLLLWMLARQCHCLLGDWNETKPVFDAVNHSVSHAHIYTCLLRYSVTVSHWAVLLSQWTN